MARLACVVALVLCTGIGAGLGARPDTDPEGTATLAGRLLVATEKMSDPRFNESVIYLVEHDQDGAFGLIVNKPIADGPIAALLEKFGIGIEGARGDVTVYYGGPVEEGLGFVLHSTDYQIDGTRLIGGTIGFTSRPQVLRDIATGKGPRQSLVAFGYAGWGPGQLDGEIGRGHWITIESDPELVFGDDDQDKWRRAIGDGGDFI